MPDLHARFYANGATRRIRGLPRDSGVPYARRAGYRRWLLESRLGPGWVFDTATTTPNSSPLEAAAARLGVPVHLLEVPDGE